MLKVWRPNEESFFNLLDEFVASDKTSALLVCMDSDGIMWEEINRNKYQKAIQLAMKKKGYKKHKALCFSPFEDWTVAGEQTRQRSPYFLINIAEENALDEAHRSLWKTKYFDNLSEKEIFFFGGMQWLAVAMAYLLWTQMLFWIPPEVWDAMQNEDGAGPIDYALTLWAFLCVGLAAFPIGIFSSCMGVTHFLHKQGRASTVAMCLKLSLPNAWRLWVFHWTDGWFTVKQILSRIPGGENRTLAQILYQEALYYAWKVGISGVLPSMVIGKGMIESGKESVEFVKQNTKEIIKLRVAYSGNCWVLGILTYFAAFPIVFYLDDGTGIGNNIANIYLYIALPICFSTGFIMFFLRPIYLLNLCNLYSDYLKTNNITVELPDNPPRAMSALVVFAILCVAALVIFYYREAIGLVDILSTI